MNCRSVQTYLSAYLDGELAGHESIRIREHLSSCRDCQAEELELKSLKQLLRGLPTEEPANEFEQRLMHNVLPAEDTSLIPRKVSYLLVGSVAAAAMLMTMGVLTAVNSRPQTAPASSSIAFEIGRDQAYQAGSDPLGGQRVVLPTSYGQTRQ